MTSTAGVSKKKYLLIYQKYLRLLYLLIEIGFNYKYDTHNRKTCQFFNSLERDVVDKRLVFGFGDIG